MSPKAPGCGSADWSAPHSGRKMRRDGWLADTHDARNGYDSADVSADHGGRSTLTSDAEVKTLRAFLEMNPHYEFANEQWQPVEAALVSPLGGGGSSQVFRVLHKSLLKRAIKFMFPRPDLLGVLGPEPFTKGFDGEIGRLASLTHQNIVKLTDFGLLPTESGELEVRYIVTDYIEGETLKSWAERDTVDGGAIVNALTGILTGLQHMHARSVLHCDLKPDNVIMAKSSSGGESIPVVLDLGVSKTLTDSNGDERPDGDFTYFFGTTGFVCPPLANLLANRSGNKARWSLIKEVFPYQDLYCFGVIVQRLLQHDGVSRKLTLGLGRSAVEALRQVSTGLVTKDSGWTARELRLALKQLQPEHLAPYGVSELAQYPVEPQYTTTTLSRVALTERMYEITWHPLFQRLHELPQLELLYYVYPGARHSRYLHAINTYQAARQLTAGLLSDWRTRIWIRSHDIKALLFKALLHDIGNYPMAHVFEDLAATRGIGDSALIPPREDLFAAFTLPVLSEDQSRTVGDLHKYVGSIRDRSGETLPGLLERHLGEPVVNAMQSIGTSTEYRHAVLGGLLSSPFDACKLAYLRDDSIMTGLPFGRTIDVDALGSALVCVHESDALGSTAAVGIKRRGVPFAAAAIEARLNMIKRGYWHEANRSIMGMFKHVVTRLITKGVLNFQEYFVAVMFKDAREAAIWLRNKFAEVAPGETNPLDCLVPPEGEVFHGEYARIFETSPTSSSGRGLHGTLKNIDPFQYERHYQKLRKIIHDQLDIELTPGQIIFDCPLKPRENLGGSAFVYDDAKGERLDELYRYVATLRDVADELDRQAKAARVLLHPVVWRRHRDKQAEMTSIVDKYLTGRF